jgi:Fe-Mn family superoxide dismutase
MVDELPKLNYSYDALEPHIDAETMELHHSKHHKAYVDGLNKAKEGLAQARGSKDFSKLKALKKELAFHGSGHALHCIFWNNMGPENQVKKEPEGKLREAIERNFSSYETFVLEFKSAGAVVEGSGWAVLSLDPNKDLQILTVEKHQNLWEMGSTPLLVCDVWEHAYYLKYQNKRPAYLDAFFNVINWDDVERRYENSLN